MTRLAGKITLNDGHQRFKPAIAVYDADHPRLWRNVLQEVHNLSGGGGRLRFPKVTDPEPFQQLTGAAVRLSRAATRLAAPDDAEALWHWTQPICGENGFDEYLAPAGLFHADKLRFALSWLLHEHLMREKNSPVPSDISAFTTLHAAQAIYESTVVCGVLFWHEALRAAQGDPVRLWTERLGKKWVNVPYLNEAVEDARKAFAAAPGHVLSDEDREAFVAAFARLNSSEVLGGGKVDLRYLRDSLGHATYAMDRDGLRFDVYEHKLLNLFEDPVNGGSPGRAPHLFRFRTVGVKNARSSLASAVAHSAACYASQRDFSYAFATGSTRGTLQRPPQELVESAKSRMRTATTTAAEKQNALEAARAQRLQASKRVQVTSVSSRPLSRKERSAARAKRKGK